MVKDLWESMGTSTSWFWNSLAAIVVIGIAIMGLSQPIGVPGCVVLVFAAIRIMALTGKVNEDA